MDNIEKMNLHERLGIVQQEMPTIEKTGKVEFGNGNNRTKYTHAELDKMLPIALPVLRKNGLLFNSSTMPTEFGPVEECCITCWETGEQINTTVPLLQVTDMQSLGKAITYARRYGFWSLTGLAADMDDDCVSNSKTSTDNNNSNENVKKAFNKPPVKITTERLDMIKSLKLIWPQVREKGFHSNPKTAVWLDKHIADDFSTVVTDHIDMMLTWTENGCPSTVVKKEAA